MKKAIIILTTILLLTTPMAFAFSFSDFSFSNMFDSFLSIFKGTEEKEEPIQNNSIKTVQKIQQSPPKEFIITMANHTYTQDSLKASINNNEKLNNYIKEFGYECLYIETDKGNKFTMTFNTNEGTLKKVTYGKSCDTQINIKESLISNIKSKGYNSTKIPQYMQKVDLPASMYFKAMGVLMG